MNLSDLLNGNSPAAQTYPVPPPAQTPMQPMPALQPPGLAATQQPVPDIQAAAPATPEEFEQRKQAWGQVLGRIQQDPNLLRAMTVMGFSLMRPGANFGSAGLAGVAAYEEGRRADAEQARTQAQDARTQEAHDERMRTSKEEREWNAQIKPLELKKARAELDLLPMDAERKALELQLRKIEVENAPALAKLELERIRAQIAASNASSAQSRKQTVMERLTEIMYNDPEVSKIVDPNARRAAAAIKAYETAKTMPAVINAASRERVEEGKQDAKATSAEQKAVAAFDLYRTLPPTHPTKMMMDLDPEQMALVQQGAQLRGQPLVLEGAGTQAPGEGQAATPAPKRRVFTSDEIEKSLGR